MRNSHGSHIILIQLPNHNNNNVTLYIVINTNMHRAYDRLSGQGFNRFLVPVTNWPFRQTRDRVKSTATTTHIVA